MGLFRNWFLLALMPGLALSANQVTEVDLVFPRANETYAPSPLTPIVFAIQNPRLLSTLKPTLYYHIDLENVSRGDSNSTVNLVHLEELNYTNGSDPYLLSFSTTFLNFEGDFSFSWDLDVQRCSYDAETDKVNSEWAGARRWMFHFSTKYGASLPDLTAFTEKGICNQTRALAARVPDTVELPPTKTADWGAASCAVSPEMTTPSPCNVKVDASAAESITASLTAAACSVPQLWTDVSCPTPSSENSASVLQYPVTRAWILAVGVLLWFSLYVSCLEVFQ
ncbi:hypothetical protein BDV59DRAFT_168550 [Aspergillus ambiguus]|uniref:uncharacterized protein n=1 Tax=Aspergillus ambiguus TaxID=176160 RepID=UPI003CCE1F83